MAGGLGGKSTVGKLRHRLALQAPTEIQDPFGTPVQTWATEAEMWGRVEMWRGGQGKEQQQAGRVQADQTHTVVIRLRDGVTDKKRFLWLSDGGNRVLNIIAVFPMTGDGNWIEVWVKIEG